MVRQVVTGKNVTVSVVDSLDSDRVLAVDILLPSMGRLFTCRLIYVVVMGTL